MSQLKINSIANVAGSASTDVLNVINGSAKAWVNFNGTGTVAIRAGYNVSSITDNGTGNYTVNLTNAMPDANYASFTSYDVNPGNVAVGYLDSSTAQTTTARRICFNGGGTAFDPATVTFAIFR